MHWCGYILCTYTICDFILHSSILFFYYYYFFISIGNRLCDVLFCAQTAFMQFIWNRAHIIRNPNCALIIVCANFTEQQHTISVESLINTRYKRTIVIFEKQNSIGYAWLFCTFDIWWWWYIYTLYLVVRWILLNEFFFAYFEHFLCSFLKMFDFFPGILYCP